MSVIDLPRLPAAQRLQPGAHVRDGGVDFVLLSAHAEAIELCLFAADGQRETARYRLQDAEDGLFHGFLAGAAAGQVYGYRAHGPHAPEHGQRFNPHKLLLDPYAREIVGEFAWNDAHYGFPPGHPDGLRALDCRDNAADALKARVAPLRAPLPRPPRRDSADLVLYELHVRGFSMQLPGLPEALRGRFAALVHPLALAHFRRLGITALCLLPVHYALSERHLQPLGLRNYWGYNTLGFFAPDPRFGAPGADPTALLDELRASVQTLHAHGIEVVLDVVFNHTAEGDERGPTLSFRGLDNRSWYRLPADDRARYENWSHCGNTLNLAHPRVSQFVLDSLRYWVETVGVDGFRFDLAPVLGRDAHGRFDPDGGFLVALRQDPLLGEVHLIAEAWDGGPEGYQVGRFPGRFRDWNDRFRDSVRGYWLGHEVGRGEFARRFTGSSDLFQHGGRRPWASVNFVSAHDGFTLVDVVSYARKRNAGNSEQDRDGRSDEISADFGAEGATEDPAIRERRRRVRRALLASLLLAQGTPMLLAGDDTGNSQRGNNNAYCQDNPIGWLDWDAAAGDDRDLVAAALDLRRAHPLLRHPQWFSGDRDDRSQARCHWLRPDGAPMQLSDWHDPDDSALACALLAAGSAQPALLLLFNPHTAERVFRLPPGGWRELLDSSRADAADAERPPLADGTTVAAHSLQLLGRVFPFPETSA